MTRGPERMTQAFRARISELAHKFLASDHSLRLSGLHFRGEWSRDRALQAVVLATVVVSGAAAAAPLSAVEAPRAVFTSMQRAVTQVAPAAPIEYRLVWEGADVDGDGRADFANPTGREPRTEDAYGSGAFGASRDGGVRRHEGVDFQAEAGQRVAAPISGYVTRIGYAYAGDDDLKFVEITNPALRLEARAFYVDPAVEVGDTVYVGQPIGRVHSLQRKYPGGMTDHVHLEVVDRRGRRIDATNVITAEYLPAARVAVAD